MSTQAKRAEVHERSSETTRGVLVGWESISWRRGSARWDTDCICSTSTSLDKLASRMLEIASRSGKAIDGDASTYWDRLFSELATYKSSYLFGPGVNKGEWNQGFSG